MGIIDADNIHFQDGLSPLLKTFFNHLSLPIKTVRPLFLYIICDYMETTVLLVS